MAEASGPTVPSLVGRGRQRALVPTRAFLVYAVRTWNIITMKELGRRVHRAPSMMSRLFSQYLSHRRRGWEAGVRRLIYQ